MQLARLKFFDRVLSSILRVLPVRKRTAIEPAPRRILVIKMSAMGDVLCMLPAVRMLSTAFPQARIEWLTTTRSLPKLFATIPFIAQTHLLPTSIKPLLGFLAGFLPKMRRYDVVVDFDQYYQISELVAWFGRRTAGFDAPLKGRTFHWSVPYDAGMNEKMQFKRIAERVIAQCGGAPQPFGSEIPELLIGFQASDKLRAFADKLRAPGRPVVVFYPGSSLNASFRRWDIANYVWLARELASRCTVLVAGGPDELSLKQPLAEAGLSGIDGINDWSLPEWLWLFREVADLFVGNDGGLLHVAESQGVPVVGIFGPALFAKWGSTNPRSIPIETELSCRPCLKNYLGEVPSTCARGDVACLTRIQPATVLGAVETVLALH